MRPNEQLRQARIGQGWTQKELANRVGTTPISIIRWEKGITSPGIAYCKKLCAAFGMNMEELGLLKNEKSQSTSLTAANTPPQSSVHELLQREIIAKRIPRPLKPLIGRQRDIDHLLQLLEHADERLFTIVGTVGVGKTQFALQLAYGIQSSFLDGVCPIFLDSLVDPSLVLPTMLHALGVAEVSAYSDIETLCSFLQEKQMLLLLDNFEHLMPATSLLSRLLATCSSLKILVTSRAGLNINGERQFPLSPLDPPDLKHNYDLAMLAQNPAIALFVVYTQAYQPHFQLTSENACAIVHICAHLEGLPLAIELAATAGMRLFSPQMLLTYLERHPLRMLNNEKKDVPERQRTLRKTIDWSYSLLNPQEQCLFRRLAIFSGGATLEALEALYERLGNKDQDVLSGIMTLVNQHLILPPSEDSTDPVHFRMLQVIRIYGQECIETETETIEIARAYASYFLSLVKKIEPQLTGAAQLQGLDILEQEQNNLRMVFTWLIEHNEIEDALHFSTNLWKFWLYRGSATEGYQQIEQALKRSEVNTISATTRAKAYYGASILAYFQGHFPLMAEHLEACLRPYQETGDRHGYAIALNALGYCRLLQGRYDSVKACYEESLPILQEVGDRWHLAEAYALVAGEAQVQGSYVQARKLHEQSIAIIREVGDRRALIQGLDFLAQTVLHLKDYATALRIYREKVFIAIELGGKPLVAASLVELGEIAAIRGQETWAAILGGVGEASHEATWGVVLPSDQKHIEHLKTLLYSRLDEEKLTQGWAQGRVMTPLQALMADTHENDLEPKLDLTALPSRRLVSHSNDLTIRELEVLRLVAEGLTNMQVAKKLVISPHTVNAHLNNIYPKIGVSSRSGAIRYAIENKFI